MNRKNFESKIFRKYFVSYLVIVFSMAVVMSGLGVYNYLKFKKENVQADKAWTENFTYNSDEILKNLYYSVNNVWTTKEYIDLNRKKDIEHMRAFNTKTGLSRYPFTKAEKTIFFLGNVDKYFCEGVYERDDFYYNNFVYGDFTREQWEDEVLKSKEVIKFLPVSEVKNGVNNKEMLPVIFSDSKCKTIALIDPTILSSEDRYIAILDSQNKILYNQLDGFLSEDKVTEVISHEARQQFVNINKNKYLLTVGKSNFCGITYLIFSPKYQIIKNAVAYRDTAIIFLLICFLVEILLAFCFAITNTNPLYKLIGRIKQNIRLENNDVELDAIGNSIIEFVQKSKETNALLEKSFENIKENFLYRVLIGGFTTNQQAMEYMNSFEIDMKNCDYFVSIIEINGVNKKASREIDIMEVSTLNTLVKEEFKDAYKEIIPVETNDGRTVLVCSAGSSTDFVFKRKVKSITKRIKDKFGLTVSVAMGGVCEGIIGIFYSYTEATSVINYMELFGKDGIVSHDEIKHNNIMFYYPLEIEQRIINLVKNAEKDEISKVFDILLEENLHRRQLSPLAFDYLKNAIISTFMRISDLLFKENAEVESNVDMLVKEIREENNAVKFFEQITVFYCQMCDIVNISAKGKNKRLKEKIENYLNENYNKPELCLYVASKEFNLSESYFSRVFKEMFECNFSAWVEKKRIDEAIRLLSETNYKIAEIAEMTGYNNSQVMRRGFKKITGLTPDEYRKNA